ncbi:DUF4389 domain-containing protein [Thermoproteota archaeon]
MREQALWRIPVGILCGITLYFWFLLVYFLSFLNWLYMLIANKRSHAISEFANNWLTYCYRFSKYMILASDHKPFPFTPLGKDVEPIEIGKEKHKKHAEEE